MSGEGSGKADEMGVGEGMAVMEMEAVRMELGEEERKWREME